MEYMQLNNMNTLEVKWCVRVCVCGSDEQVTHIEAYPVIDGSIAGKLWHVQAYKYTRIYIQT